MIDALADRFFAAIEAGDVSSVGSMYADDAGFPADDNGARRTGPADTSPTADADHS